MIYIVYIKIFFFVDMSWDKDKEKDTDIFIGMQKFLCIWPYK